MFEPDIKIETFNGYNEDMLPTVHILHGIHRSDAHHGPGDWAKYFIEAGFRVKIWDYGHVYALTARLFINPHVVNELLSVIEDGDILVGHSNGCAIIADAMDSSACAGGIVFLNPALNVDRKIPCEVPWIHVYCNKGDLAVTAGKWWRRLNPVSWFVRHPYGEQGRRGPNFIDNRYTVLHGESPPNGLPIVNGHSHINSPKIISSWGPYGVKLVLDSLN